MKYRNLGGAGVKVSSLCLGAMTFGEADEKSFMHKVGSTEETSHAVLDRALDKGIKSTQVSNATNNPTHGQQDCWIRTDSKGVVYLFWEAIKANTGRAIYMTRSFNGGQSFDQNQIVSPFNPTGLIDPVSGDRTFDGLAGARDGTFPTADIANGAPTGADATDEIVVAWQEGPTPSDTNPGPNEKVKIAYSTDGGGSWSFTTDAADPGDRPNVPAIAISPDGTDVYLTYNSFSGPWQSTTANPRPTCAGS